MGPFQIAFWRFFVLARCLSIFKNEMVDEQFPRQPLESRCSLKNERKRERPRMLSSILDCIGNTPLVGLKKMTPPRHEILQAKCEFLNPGGSIKDRLGFYLLSQAEKRGEIQPGGTVVEATSGNTGVGLALYAAVRGYKCIFVMPDKMSEEKRQFLRAFGAQVVITPTGVPPESSESHYSVAAEIAKKTPNSFYANQYENPLNREMHFTWTGPELWEQTQGECDALVAGMGTCGTISGVGRYLKEKKRDIQIIGVDPEGSILHDLFRKRTPAPARPYLIEGIGEDIQPGNCDFSVVDDIVQVSDCEAMQHTRALLSREGMLVGTSSGAAVAGALKYLRDHPFKRVIVLLPDSGNRYLSKVFNDEWMKEKGFYEPKTWEATT